MDLLKAYAKMIEYNDLIRVFLENSHVLGDKGWEAWKISIIILFNKIVKGLEAQQEEKWSQAYCNQVRYRLASAILRREITSFKDIELREFHAIWLVSGGMDHSRFVKTIIEAATGGQDENN